MRPLDLAVLLWTGRSVEFVYYAVTITSKAKGVKSWHLKRMRSGFPCIGIGEYRVVVCSDKLDLERRAFEDIIKEVKGVGYRAFLAKLDESKSGGIVLSCVLDEAPRSIAAQELDIHLQIARVRHLVTFRFSANLFGLLYKALTF